MTSVPTHSNTSCQRYNPYGRDVFFIDSKKRSETYKLKKDQCEHTLHQNKVFYVCSLPKDHAGDHKTQDPLNPATVVMVWTCT